VEALIDLLPSFPPFCFPLLPPSIPLLIVAPNGDDAAQRRRRSTTMQGNSATFSCTPTSFPPSLHSFPPFLTLSLGVDDKREEGPLRPASLLLRGRGGKKGRRHRDYLACLEDRLRVYDGKEREGWVRERKGNVMPSDQIPPASSSPSPRLPSLPPSLLTCGGATKKALAVARHMESGTRRRRVAMVICVVCG